MIWNTDGATFLILEAAGSRQWLELECSRLSVVMQKLSVLPASTVGPVKSPRLKHPLRSPSSMAKVPSLLFELEVCSHDAETIVLVCGGLGYPVLVADVTQPRNNIWEVSCMLFQPYGRM